MKTTEKGKTNDRELERMLRAGFARHGSAFGGMLVDCLQRSGFQGSSDSSKGANASVQSGAAGTVTRFAEKPSIAAMNALPIGARYRVGDGPVWHVLEHVIVRGDVVAARGT